MGRDTRARKSLGSLHSQIKESRVLMVGAGGIGCELLKNLVLTGFGEIHIVDLDTIDLSNLNRQFLFGMNHIKKSKALVAKETAGKFNPNVRLEAHHANIKDPQFNIKWFKGFDIVFNALDNLDARKHVNRMCLTADIPLIESGTTGYHGQVQIIKQGITECYECNPKAVPKSFPVCTIRSTPSQPIHCIVWAKSYLFTEVFGTSEESSPELDPTENSENAQEIANLKREAEELKNVREKMDSPDFVESVFRKVFEIDIERLKSMEDMWKTRTPPTALNFKEIESSAKEVGAAIENDQIKWTLAENFAMFADSLKRLAQRMKELKNDAQDGDTPPVLSFDKDDEDTLDFVAASANLRSIIFGIEVKSKFDIKQMAGNIIPAIATTNAVTAGLCVLQAFKVLRNDYSGGRMIFVTKRAEQGFSAEKLAPPQKTCEVCGVARLILEANIKQATIRDLVEKVLVQKLGYSEELSVLSQNLLYDVDFDDNIDTPLEELGFGEETFVTIVDDRDGEPEQRVNLVIAITNNESLIDGPITIPEKIDIRVRNEAPVSDPDSKPNGLTNGSSLKRTIEEVEPSAGSPSKRRKRAILEDRESISKSQTTKPQDEVIAIVDDEGAIIID
ncbi:hypothetical protein EDC01DRAFT_54529 [Geopyxis carbonaria]|nr:hypothetical protein EDC01DRAFT_54529 [Geopyxis carbonaria]